jgi:type IV secretory pathway TraG/TraD family ATPase VirD4
MLQWGGDDAFTHLLCVGPTRCGKTATLLKPIIYQILQQKKAGIPVGLSVVEPKGDMAAMVAEMCEAMEIPYTHIDPDKNDSHRFNPMIGDTDDVAEATVAVLKGLFGKQEAFFAAVQELSSRNVTNY